MRQTINEWQFADAFKAMGREDNFSRNGLRKLFEYLEELEQDCGNEIDLDVIALCCDYSEDKLKNVLKEYSLKSIDELRDHTQVIMLDDEEYIIYAAF